MKGTVRPRNGSWQARLPYKNKYGVQTARTGTAKTKEAAEALLRKFINEETRGVDMTNPSFEVVANEWYSEKELSASNNTLSTYGYSKDKLIARFGKIGIKDIKRKDVASFYTDMKKQGYETKFTRGVLNAIMLYAISTNLIMSNPAKEVKVTRTKEKREAKILNVTERQALVESFRDTRYYYPIQIDLKTGMRLGELAGLTWDKVNFTDNYIEVSQQYTRFGMVYNKVKSSASFRNIYMDDETVEILQELRMSGLSESNFVFMEHEAMYEGMRKVLEPHEITPHDLRHNHATDLLGFMNPADAAKRMGHTVAEYIKTYVHASDDVQKQAAKNLPVLKNNSDLNKSRNKEGNKVIDLAPRAT